MPETTNILGTKTYYEACSLSDVGPHFDKISRWVPEEEYIEFNERMMDCVEAGNAWKTEHTFLYYEHINRKIAHGVALYGSESPMELLALFIGVFWQQDQGTGIMRFKLHPGKFMEEYRALLTDISIKRTHADPDHPLMVRIDHLRKKFRNIMQDQIT